MHPLDLLTPVTDFDEQPKPPRHPLPPIDPTWPMWVEGEAMPDVWPPEVPS